MAAHSDRTTHSAKEVKRHDHPFISHILSTYTQRMNDIFMSLTITSITSQQRVI